MIICTLNGGLGNQLFQYALGRRLSWERSIPLRFDLKFLQSPKSYRNYQLDLFQVEGRPVSEQEKERFDGLPVFRKLRSIYQEWQPYYRQKNVQERHLGFDQNILSVSKNVCLRGYWQSEKYFKPIANIIRAEIQPKANWSRENLEVLAHMQTGVAVSVHFRRGDYLSKIAFGVLPKEYYEEAGDVIRKKHPQAHFFVFSDDIEWVRENIDLQAPTTYVSHNTGQDSYWDMILISKCQHHIIANSTFSWWGAWLNPKKDKIVLAPKSWFVKKFSNPDLLPEEWIKV